MTRRALCLVLAALAVASCTTYQQQLSRMTDDQVCKLVSRKPGFGWQVNYQATVEEAIDRGLSLEDCGAHAVARQRQIDDANARAEDAEQRAWEAEQRERALRIRLEDEGDD